MTVKIALSIGHNFALENGKNPDEWAVSNGTTEAKTTQSIINALISGMCYERYEFVKIPEKLTIRQRQNWLKENAKNIDAFLELHLDSATAGATGSTVFYTAGYDWAKEQAIKFAEAYSRKLGLKNRWAKPDTATRHGQLGVLRSGSSAGIPSWLVELGFISNSDDLARIRRDGVAGIIAGCDAIWK